MTKRSRTEFRPRGRGKGHVQRVRELIASGEYPGSRDVDIDDLSPDEKEILELALDGAIEPMMDDLLRD